MRFVVLVAVAGFLFSAAPPADAEDPPRVTHGLVAGDLHPDRAVLWARCSRPAHLRFELRAEGAPASPAVTLDVDVTEDGGLIGKWPTPGLKPATSYVATATCYAGDGPVPAATSDESARVRFRTPPTPEIAAPIRFAWSGDLGGQNVCRDREVGYAIFQHVAATHPDFFVGLGDMIYADSPCLAVGRYGNAQIPGPDQRGDLASYRAIWAYNRGDPSFLSMLSSVPYEAVWDDHEVRNDFGPRDDMPLQPGLRSDVHLMPIGLRAFLDWSTLVRHAGEPLHRSLRWGRHLELFILDTRSERDPNHDLDDPARPRHLLGDRQLAWLEKAVATSDATWKVFVVSVPLSVATGRPGAPDSFASGGGAGGSEHQLMALLRMLRNAGVSQPIFITTDVHFAYAIRLQPFPETPNFLVYELAVGPLSAGLAAPKAPNPSLHPELLFSSGAPASAPLADFAAARRWFNFGTLAVDEAGLLEVAVIDSSGKSIFSLPLGARVTQP